LASLVSVRAFGGIKIDFAIRQQYHRIPQHLASYLVERQIKTMIILSTQDGGGVSLSPPHLI